MSRRIQRALRVEMHWRQGRHLEELVTNYPRIAILAEAQRGHGADK